MIAGIFLLITYFLQMTSSSAKREAPQLRYQIQEESPVGTIVSNLIGDTRLRISADSSIQFRFLTDSDSMFEISSSTGVITTAVVIDREGLPACRHKVVCELSLDVVIQPNQHFQILKIIVEILDVNDNAPTFRESSITLSINEAAAVGSSYIIPTATDLDSPAYAVQRYELVTPSEDFGLQVNPKLDGTLEAKLLLKTKLDRETEPRLQLKLVAFDGGATPRTGTLIIDINVLDSNDNRPEFTRDQYDVSIMENLPIGTVVIQVKAIDRDFGPNGLVGYSFAQQTQNLHGSIFGIRNASGEIFVRGNVDHEKSSVFQLIVIGQDHGPDLLSSEVTVVVHVEDQNDNAPTITIHTLSEGGAPVAEISEDSVVGTFVAHVTVTDPDSGLNGWVNCTLNEKVFALVRQYSNEYRIETAAILDRERTEQYALNIRCQDGGTVPRVSDKNLRVIVTDVNDCPPMFSQQTYKATLTENNYVGVTVLQVSATDWDADDNSKIVYSIPGNVNALFHVDQRGVVSAHAAIDREQYDTFRFPIMAIDGGSPPKTGSALVVISIEDVNDEKPTFSRSNFVMNVSENEPAGSMVGIVTAADKDGPLYNVFRFSFLSGSTVTDTFGIDPVTGAIITQHQLDREKQDLYRFVIQVRDQKSPNFSDTASVSVNVIDKNDNTPTFVYPTPSNISVSNQLPIGTSVASVTARDADTGENSRLAFKIVETRDNNGTFRIDPETGNVYTGRRLNGIEYRIYPISVTVSDHGSPPRSASTVIFIHVNQSIPYVGSQNADDPSNNFSSEYHVVLVVAMVSGCSVITVILIVAVVIVRQKEKERRIRKYNCRVEALRMLTTKDNNASGSTPEGSPYKKLQNGGNGTLLTNVDAVDNEVHPWVHKTGGDTDKESVHSVEGSVTDSGRGPSEEGEAGHSRHNRERYLPPPPPPPRGAYWLQQSSRAAAAAAASTNAPSHPTVRFQGLSSTPEEVGDSSPGLNGTLKKTTFGQTPSYNCNGGRVTPNGCIKSELHHNTYQGPQKVFEQCPKQTNTLDQLPKQRNNYTLDQLGKQQQQQQHHQQQQHQQQQGPINHYKPSLMSTNTLVGFIPGKIVEDGCVVISRDVTV